MKQRWVLEVTLVNRPPVNALRLAAAIVASIGDRNGDGWTRGVFRKSDVETAKLLRFGGKDTTRRRAVREARSWLRRNGFLLDYQRAVGGGGRMKRVGSYVIVLPIGEGCSAPLGHRGVQRPSSFDYRARIGTKGTTYSKGNAGARKRETASDQSGGLTASEIRIREQTNGAGELWELAESFGEKPNPALNRWVRAVGEGTIMDDPVGSFREFLAV